MQSMSVVQLAGGKESGYFDCCCWALPPSEEDDEAVWLILSEELSKELPELWFREPGGGGGRM